MLEGGLGRIRWHLASIWNVTGHWIVHWDKKLRMERRFQIIRIDDGITLLRAGMRFACIELSSGRARRMPPEFIAGYGPAVLKGATPQRDSGSDM